jgi:hypothetical protein
MKSELAQVQRRTEWEELKAGFHPLSGFSSHPDDAIVSLIIRYFQMHSDTSFVSEFDGIGQKIAAYLL